VNNINQRFIEASFGGNFPQTSEIPPRSFGQVYSSIQNPDCSDPTRCSHSSVGTRYMPSPV